MAENRKITFNPWEASERMFGKKNHAPGSFLQRKHFRSGTKETTPRHSDGKDYDSFGEVKEIEF